MTVTIGSLIRDRAWILNDFLGHLLDETFPRAQTALYFLINDSKDESEAILRSFKRAHDSEYLRIDIEVMNLGTVKDERRTPIRLQVIESLVTLRNRMLQAMDTDWLLNVDSDILLEPGSIESLLRTGKEIVSGLINNADPRVAYHPNIYDLKLISPYREFPTTRPFQVNVTGALILYSRKACKTVEFRYSPLGEDVGFCRNARAAGFEIWCEPGVTAYHARCRDLYEKERAGK